MEIIKKVELHPLVKWAGGKSQLLKTISSKYPNKLGSDIDKYAEPFIGGGAVLWNILEKYTLRSVYISDINPWLINIYKTIKYYPDDLVNTLKTLESTFLSFNTTERKKMYYSIRDKYNAILINNCHSIDIDAASFFIFLNKTCFNGLYRVNKQGLYNVPMGAYKNPKICDKSAIMTASKALQNVNIECADFEACNDFVDSKTFVYFDPPYRPLTQTASFTSYNNACFDDKEQSRLAHFITKLSNKGAYIVTSNSDPHNTNPSDFFFDKLYAHHNISRIQANRMINRDATKRGSISELLISTF